MTAPIVTRRFPDVTRILVAELEVWVGGDSTRTGPETPADLQAKLPFIRAVRIGGSRDRLSDFPTVSIDVFASSYTGAETLMEDIDQWLAGPPPPISLFDRVERDVAPRRLPWGDETLFRWQAQYTVVTRRVPRI